MTDPTVRLVSPSDIAELAKVSRGAVSNWRRRPTTDFPQPIGGTETNPLFSLAEVSSWLVARGYHLPADRVEASVWGAMNTLRGVMRPDDAVEALLALACIRKAEPSFWRNEVHQYPPSIDALRHISRGSGILQRLIGSDHVFEADEPSLRVLINVVDSLDEGHISDVTDSVLERSARAQIKLGAEWGYVGSRISRMLASLASGYPGLHSVYDPTCGVGETLIEIARHTGRLLTLTGQEINRTAGHVALQRAFLRGVDIEVMLGNTLLHDAAPALRADVVVAEPPFNLRFEVPGALADNRFEFGLPPRSSADLAWVQHCIAHLAEEGIAYVITAPGALFHSGAERAIRTELIHRGSIRAIVGLPPKLHPHTSIELALWVLQRPRTGQRSVLLVDAAEVEDAVERVPAWLKGNELEIDAPHRSVQVSELLAGEAVLQPRRWMEVQQVAPEEVAESFLTNATAARSLVEAASEVLSALPEPTSASAARVVSVDQLLQQGVVKLRIGRSEASLPDSDGPVITAADVRAGVLGPRSTQADDDFTQPGDVLVVTWNRISAVVDSDGGRRIGNGVHRLRIVETSLLRPDYLAAVLGGSWNDRHFGGTSIQRAPLRQLEVPLIELTDQQRTAERLREARELGRLGTEIAERATRIEAALRDAIRYGVHSHPETASRTSPLTTAPNGKNHAHGLD